MLCHHVLINQPLKQNPPVRNRIQLVVELFVLLLFLQKYVYHIIFKSPDLTQRNLAIDFGVLELEHLVSSGFLALLGGVWQQGGPEAWQLHYLEVLAVPQLRTVEE